MDHPPTAEQGAARDLFRFGDNLAIEAGAGTGKTTTLRMIGADAADRTGQYVAFNRSIVLEAQRTMPSNVAANTAHSLAMGAIGYKYRARLRESARQPGDQVARYLGIDPFVITFGTQRKVLQPSYLAGLVQRAVTVFCQTADDVPAERHVPYVDGIDVPDSLGRKGWANNREVRRHIAGAIGRAWADVQKLEGGRLRFRHEHYLKMWQLSRPTLPVDFLLFDEAQDASPVMLDVVARQTHAQLVFVGDSQQQIYEFTGAVNALAKVPASQRVLLTQSFRFGPEIAARANHVLAEIGTDLRLRGLDSIQSTVGWLERPRCILTRTNATAVNEVLRRQKAGEHVHLVGGGTEVLTFAKAARELQRGQSTWHPELACFTTWGEVQAYCLAPTTRVLTESLEWRQIGTLAIGDRLVGFDEDNQPGQGGRRFRTVNVEATTRLRKPTVKIVMADHRVITASSDHRWLVPSGKSLRWKRTSSLKPGDKIMDLGWWAEDDSRDAGWLAGLYDGEGCVVGASEGSRSRAIVLAQKEGPVLDRARRLLHERGFDFGENRRGVTHLTHRGGLADRIRFLGTIRPERLVAQAGKLWEGRRVERLHKATVMWAEPMGEQEVVAVQTSGRTFVAEGLLSHNCETDPQGSELALLVTLVDTYGVDTIVSALERMCPEEAADVVVSTAHKSKGREWDSVQLADDFPDPRQSFAAMLDPEAGLPELRLAYVAATRAVLALDVTRVPVFDDMPVPAGVATVTMAVPLALEAGDQ